MIRCLYYQFLGGRPDESVSGWAGEGQGGGAAGSWVGVGTGVEWGQTDIAHRASIAYPKTLSGNLHRIV